jgi:hypothetical protein
MKHFYDENGYSYGVKETYGSDGLVKKWEKVNFINYELWDMVDGLVEKEIPHGEDRKRQLLNFHGDSRITEGAAPFVRFIGIQTTEFSYSIYKTEKERDDYYNRFNN